MSSTSTSSGDRLALRAGGRLGFTLVELLIGLTLALSLSVVTAPVWLSLERSGTRATDDTIWVLQARVAASRFERDMRLATASESPFAVSGAVLEASDSQVVFLGQQASGGSRPIVVEWEIVKGSLMRRWGPCPLYRPATYAHSVFTDNKTMLEGLSSGSSFTYVVDGTAVAGTVAPDRLARVEAVLLHVSAVDKQGDASTDVERDAFITRAAVGR